jgi:hypothetical protein
MLMHRLKAPFVPDEDRKLLHAQSALGKSRAALTDDLDKLLIDAPPSPLAAMIGGHLLILEQLKRPSLRVERLKPLVEDLRNQLGGISSGDFDALALAASSPDDPAVRQLTAPPMFKASWDLLAEASLKQRDLVPRSIYARVFAISSTGTFVTWSSDKESRTASLKQLKSNFAPEIEERHAARARDVTNLYKNLGILPDPLTGGTGLTDPALPPPASDMFGGGGGGGGGGSGGGLGADAGFGGDTGSGGFGGALAESEPEPHDARPSEISEETAAKLKALGLPASALDFDL